MCVCARADFFWFPEIGGAPTFDSVPLNTYAIEVSLPNGPRAVSFFECSRFQGTGTGPGLCGKQPYTPDRIVEQTYNTSTNSNTNSSKNSPNRPAVAVSETSTCQASEVGCGQRAQLAIGCMGGYFGIMENKLETTIVFWGYRRYRCLDKTCSPHTDGKGSRGSL